MPEGKKVMKDGRKEERWRTEGRMEDEGLKMKGERKEDEGRKMTE